MWLRRKETEKGSRRERQQICREVQRRRVAEGSRWRVQKKRMMKIEGELLGEWGRKRERSRESGIVVGWTDGWSVGR